MAPACSRRRLPTAALLGVLLVVAGIGGAGCAGAGGAEKDSAVGDDDVDADTSNTPDADTSSTPDADTSATADAGTIDADPVGTPDAAPTCSPCQLVAQCGCGNMEACDLGGANPAQGTTACRPVLVGGTTTSTCNASSSCAAGYACLGGGAGQQSCNRYCSSDTDCQGGGGKCVIEVTSAGTPIPGVKVCSAKCDPFTAMGCPTAWACHAYSDAAEAKNFSACVVPGAGGDGATCAGGDAQCAAGFTCVNVGGQNRCKKYCDKGDGNPGCPGGQTCVGLVDAANQPLVVDNVTYGVCN